VETMQGQVCYGPAEIERLTGIPMNTLRAWERRYGMPRPQRGAGGHRLYSEADLKALQWIRKQLNAGVSISHAIANLQSQQPSGAHVHPHALTQDLLTACAEFDERRAERILSDAFSFHTVERVCLEIIVPTLVALGEGWVDGQYSIAVEHFTTSLLIGQLHATLRILPIPQGRPLIFVACGPGEHHAVPALMLTVLLRRAGWRANFFGANLPLNDWVKILPELRPDLLMLSISMPENLLELESQLDFLRSSQCLPPVIVGGAAVATKPELATRLGCHYLGNDIMDVLDKLETLCKTLGLR